MNAIRKAIESLYEGKCTIKENQPLKDPDNKRTIHKEDTVLEEQPCKLSYQTITSAGESNNIGTASQSIKLIIAPEIVIKAGTKIIVTQHGKTAEYSRSGEPAVYTNHQEVMLELFKGWT